MILDKLDADLNFQQTALRVRGQRQELIAANIANADTPNYKARDIDFASVMKKALSSSPEAPSSVQAVVPEKTDAGHLDGVTYSASNPSSSNESPLYRPIIQGSVDGNTVDMDVERNQFSDNAIRYEASLTMINGQIKNMITALQS